MADIINELSGLDDASLGAKLGFNDKVKAFRDDLARADKLSGDARKSVVKAIDQMFKPNIYPDELRWKVESAERKEKCKTTPASVVTDAGCDCLGD